MNLDDSLPYTISANRIIYLSQVSSGNIPKFDYNGLSYFPFEFHITGTSLISFVATLIESINKFPSEAKIYMSVRMGFKEKEDPLTTNIRTIPEAKDVNQNRFIFHSMLTSMIGIIGDNVYGFKHNLDQVEIL